MKRDSLSDIDLKARESQFSLKLVVHSHLDLVLKLHESRTWKLDFPFILHEELKKIS